MKLKIDANTVVVFDLDDTLIHELDFLKSAYLEIAKYLDKDNYRKVFVKLFSLYRNNKNVFQYCEELYGISIKTLVDVYRNHTPKTMSTLPSAVQVIQAIKNKGGKVGLITDGRSITQRNKLKAAKLDSIFDAMVISEEIGSEKPSINNFKTIEKSLEAKEYYYVADNVKKDFITPNQLGWQTIQLIDSGLNVHSNDVIENLSKLYDPNYRIFTFEELEII